jgi:hypothetical protein
MPRSCSDRDAMVCPQRPSCQASGLPNPMEPTADGKCHWPFYVALSLFRGAAILAGVRAGAYTRPLLSST